MLTFKTASRSREELKTAMAELDEVFAIVKGKNGRLNVNAVRHLDENRYEIAQLVVQLINDVVLTTDPTPFLVETLDGDIRDDYVFQQLNSALRVVQRSYGSKPLSQRLTYKEFGLTTTHKEIAVEVPLEEVAVGRITPSQVAQSIADTILRYRISTVLSGLDAGVPSGNDHTGLTGFTLRYSGLSEANLKNALDGLMDESDAPTIFARHIALIGIRDFTSFSNITQRDFDVRGMIGEIYGAPIVSLRDQFHRVDSTHLIPSDRIYISSGTKGAKFMTKDVSFLDWAVVDPRTSTFGTGVRIEDGLLVWDPYQYRIIEV